MCWGQLLTPDSVPAHQKQLLFPTGHLEASGPVELGSGDVVGPWPGTGWPQSGVTYTWQWMDKVPCVLCPELCKPTQHCCSCLKEKSGHPGLSLRCWSEGASATLQRSLWGRRTGAKLFSMANSCWERGLLAVCLMRLCLMELGK